MVLCGNNKHGIIVVVHDSSRFMWEHVCRADVMSYIQSTEATYSQCHTVGLWTPSAGRRFYEAGKNMSRVSKWYLFWNRTLNHFVRDCTWTIITFRNQLQIPGSSMLWPVTVHAFLHVIVISFAPKCQSVVQVGPGIRSLFVNRHKSEAKCTLWAKH